MLPPPVLFIPDQQQIVPRFPLSLGPSQLRPQDQGPLAILPFNLHPHSLLACIPILYTHLWRQVDHFHQLEAPSPAFSDVMHSSLVSKHCHHSDSLHLHHTPFLAYEPQWLAGEQVMFETAIACLTASAGLLLQWVENPEWLALCEHFIPVQRVHCVRCSCNAYFQPHSKPSSRLHRNIVGAWRKQSHMMDGQVATTIITSHS